MNTISLRSAAAAALVAAIAFGSMARPAKANTTTTLLITAAAVAGLVTGINVLEKNAKARTVVGYLPNGSVVYADGHVVAPNGQSWYPGNFGQTIACNGQYCVIQGGNGYPYGYGYNGAGSYPGAAYPGSRAYPGAGSYPARPVAAYPGARSAANAPLRVYARPPH